MKTIALAALLLHSMTMLAQAQLPFTLRDCLADRDEDARLHICAVISGTEEQRAQGAIEASRILRGRGEYEAAVDLLDSRGRNVLLDVELGHVWFESGIWAMADFHFENALLAGLDPDPDLRARMVDAFHLYAEEVHFAPAQPQFQGAILAYERALGLDPDHLNSLPGRAGAYLGLGQHAAAIADLDRAIALGADWTGHLMRARARLGLGDGDGAIADFRRVLAENPGHRRARDALVSLGVAP